MASNIVQVKVIEKQPIAALELEVNNFLNNNVKFMVLSIQTFIATDNINYIAVITYQMPDL